MKLKFTMAEYCLYGAVALFTLYAFAGENRIVGEAAVVAALVAVVKSQFDAAATRRRFEALENREDSGQLER